MVSAGESVHDRLRRLVVERRRALTLSVSAAAKAAGINRATWGAMERGDRDTEDYIFGGIEKALRWQPGSVDAILGGGDPVPLDEAPPPAVATWARKLEEVKAIADDTDMSPGLRAWAARQADEIDAIIKAARAEAAARSRGHAS